MYIHGIFTKRIKLKQMLYSKRACILSTDYSIYFEEVGAATFQIIRIVKARALALPARTRSLVKNNLGR